MENEFTPLKGVFGGRAVYFGVFRPIPQPPRNESIASDVFRRFSEETEENGGERVFGTPKIAFPPGAFGVGM